MRFSKFLIACIFCFSIPLLYSQNETQDLVDYSDTNNIDGIWENSSKIISLKTGEDGTIDANIVLKTFYGYYYDGVFPLDESVPVNLVRFENSLFTEYWMAAPAFETLGDPLVQEEDPDPVFKVKIEKPMEFDFSSAIPASGILWLPKSNSTDLSIDETIIKQEVLGYYVDENATYEIRYWLTELPYEEKKVELKLTQNEEEESVFIDKFIQIGDYVYTSATGLRTEIRNVTVIVPFSDDAKVNEDSTILVFGDPYLVLSDINNVEDAILAHNSIIRPPRDGRAKFVEPSIYKKLEQMTIEDFDNPYAPIH